MPTLRAEHPPYTCRPKPTRPAKRSVFRKILDYFHAMRTACAVTPAEAVEWFTLEDSPTRTYELEQAA